MSAAASLTFVLSQSGQSKMLLDFVRYPGDREGRIISRLECLIKKELTQNPGIKALELKASILLSRRPGVSAGKGAPRYTWVGPLQCLTDFVQFSASTKLGIP